MSPLLEWLDDLENRDRKGYAKCLDRILQLATLGNELRRPVSDILRDEIRELRTKSGRVQYRILYFFCGSNVACLSHGITKEGKVPDAEIDRAVERNEMVVSDLDRFTVSWPVEE